MLKKHGLCDKAYNQISFNKVEFCLKIENGSELQQQNQEYLIDVTYLQNMFSSLAIRIVESVLKDFFVADSSQRKSYSDAIAEILNE